MKYTDTKTLYPNEEKSVGFDKESLEQLKNINERLDNMSNDIADLNNEVDGLDNQVITENLQATQASLQEASVNELSAQSASIPELEAGNATANKVTSRGEIKGAQLEITGISHLKDDVTVDGKVTSESVRAGSVTTDHLIADEMDVTDFTVDELSVTEKATIKEEEVETSVVTTQTVSSQTVESQEVTSQNVVSQDVTSQEVTNQEVENSVIEDAEIKALTSGGNTFNFNSDNSISITEDSYIRIRPEINSEVRLILKTALNATILAASISVDVPAADKANVHLVYSNTEALSDIYFDVNGNLWLKLETGVRGTLYFMQGGINAITPETDSVVNPAFDPAAEGTIHYGSGTHGDIFITSKTILHSEVVVEDKATFKKTVEVEGNMHVEGNLDVDGIITIGEFAAERAQYLGNSDYVTADDEGNLEAKSGAFDGDVTATGEISSTGDMTAGGDVNAVGDVTGTNGEFSETVKAEGGFEGDLTGDVTGDVTGSALTANELKNAVIITTKEEFIAFLALTNKAVGLVMPGQYNFTEEDTFTWTYTSYKKLVGVFSQSLTPQRPRISFHKNNCGPSYKQNRNVYNAGFYNLEISNIKNLSVGFYDCSISGAVSNCSNFFNCELNINPGNDDYTSMKVTDLYNCKITMTGKCKPAPDSENPNCTTANLDFIENAYNCKITLSRYMQGKYAKYFTQTAVLKNVKDCKIEFADDNLIRKSSFTNIQSDGLFDVLTFAYRWNGIYNCEITIPHVSSDYQYTSGNKFNELFIGGANIIGNTIKMTEKGGSYPNMFIAVFGLDTFPDSEFPSYKGDVCFNIKDNVIFDNVSSHTGVQQIVDMSGLSSLVCYAFYNFENNTFLIKKGAYSGVPALSFNSNKPCLNCKGNSVVIIDYSSPTINAWGNAYADVSKTLAANANGLNEYTSASDFSDIGGNFNI